MESNACRGLPARTREIVGWHAESLTCCRCARLLAQLAGLMLVELLTAAPSARQTSQGGLGMVEPAAIGEAILDEREAIARRWAAEVAEGTPAALQALLVADLESDLVELTSSTDEVDDAEADD